MAKKPEVRTTKKEIAAAAKVAAQNPAKTEAAPWVFPTAEAVAAQAAKLQEETGETRSEEKPVATTSVSEKVRETISNLPWIEFGVVKAELLEAHRVTDRYGSLIPVLDIEAGRWVTYQVQVESESGSTGESFTVSAVMLKPILSEERQEVLFEVALFKPKNGKFVRTEFISPMQVRAVGRMSRVF